jgi:hypothetical protein
MAQRRFISLKIADLARFKEIFVAPLHKYYNPKRVEDAVF